MAIFRGLNTQLYLADIDDKDTALESLGLSIDDFNVIRGLDAGGVTSLELRMISGLDLDQKKELYAISRTSATIGNLLRDMKDIQVPLEFNMRINDQLRAGAIKYNYLDWTNPTTTKSADISTSRVSSWSSTDSPATSTSDIFYGGEVEVLGNNVEASSIHTLTPPILARYPAEIPTHTITIDINGSAKEVHAMKGIPLTYEGYFRNANLRGRVDQIGSIPPTWVVRNQDDSRWYETYTPNDENNPRAGGSSIVGANSWYYFRDSRAHPRTLEFYYNPNNILELDLHSLNLNSLPNVSLPNLTHYYLYFNDFYEVPNFASIAPSLTYIHMQGNNLSRTGVDANVQLDRFSTSLETLIMHGCFSDSTQIDLRKYTNLRYMGLNSYYSRYGRRRMTGGTITPHVNPSSIETYTVTYQPYSRLSSTVCDSTNIVNVYIDANDITGARTPAGVDSDVYTSSPRLSQWTAYSNNHAILKCNGASINSITYYAQTYSSPGGIVNDATGRSVAGKFTGCSKLSNINLYGTSATGDINVDFNNIPSLDRLEVRWGWMGGSFTDTSFTGSENLRVLLMAGSRHSGSNFFGALLDGNGQVIERGKALRKLENLQYFYFYSNRSAQGELPDFSKNKKLRVLYMPNLGLSGFIPNFGSNDILYYIRLSGNYYTGSVPSFNGNQYYYLFFENNQLTGNIPLQQGANIRQFMVHYNQLTGNVPSFEFCPRLQYAYFYNNQLSGWSTETMNRNTWLRRLDISNNKLSIGAVRNIISDMLENYQNNPRSGVTVNMLGQTDFSGNPVTEAEVIADEATADNLQFLRTVGWTVLI
jgi:Leucine-rich repeat (LRR) protein